LENGKRALVEFEDLALDSSQFNELGAAYEQITNVQKYSVGGGSCFLLDYRSLIDFATDYLKLN
ncbi:MAG: AAC(3) family N-acetyltransferase, partial [Turicibacter sp.]